MNDNIISNRIKVTVGGQVFEIPAEKAQSLLAMLGQWQSIATENTQTQSNNPNWKGKTLLFG